MNHEGTFRMLARSGMECVSSPTTHQESRAQADKGGEM
jgi:hypothetical protein